MNRIATDEQAGTRGLRLVTGMPRSGTTWLASMLDAGGETVYINEPTNPARPPGQSPGVLRATIRGRYQYVCTDNEDEFAAAYADIARLRYHLVDELRANRGPLDLALAGRYIANYAKGRLKNRLALIADPFAVFNASWFSSSLGVPVVVAVRHPAATVSSRKRLGRRLIPQDFLSQPLLMRDYLEPYRAELENLSGDIIVQGALLWKMVYGSMYTQASADPGIKVVRHEDLSREPIREFEHLFVHFGLQYNTRARRAIERSTSAKNPAELSLKDAYKTRVNSKQNITAWHRRLTEQEVRVIRNITAPISDLFYTEPDWVLS